MLRKIFIMFFVLLAIRLSAQQPVQTIRGNIADMASDVPLAFASVGLQNTSFGAMADSLGHFTIKNVPIGRYNILVSLVGYEPVVLKEILVTSSKEVFLNIAMKESTTMLKEVVIKHKVNKEQPLNTMATLSAKMLSVEEADRKSVV